MTERSILFPVALAALLAGCGSTTPTTTPALAKPYAAPACR
jgi:type IV pilus biogenesis protein CpaD/CtpE